MSQDLGRARPFLALPLVLFLLLSCANSPSDSQTPQPSAVLLPYASPTATPPPESTEDIAQATAAPTASPTPFTYLIVEGDTLLGIAERHGVSLDDLLVANPDVDARFLSIGQALFIPQGQSSASASLAEPTPLPLTASDVACHQSNAGELWCFMLVENSTDVAAENLRADIRLLSNAGAVVAQKEAIPPIQKLDTGAQVPIVAYWDTAPEGWASATGQLLNAFRLEDPGERYLELVTDELNVRISDSGMLLEVWGTISGEGADAASAIWVLAVAYDESGNVVGLRKWERTDDELDFALTVYSLGAPISAFDVLLEGRR